MRKETISGTIKNSAAMIIVALFAFVIMASIAHAAPTGPISTAPGQNKITCFDGGGGAGGTCTINTNGAKGSATLDTSTGGAAGVYYPGYNGSFYDVLLSDVTQLSFMYTGDTGAAGPDPHFSIPIDTNDDGVTDFYAFVPASTCNNGQGKVDVIGDATCTVYTTAGPVSGWPNWAAFVADQPAGAVISFGDYAFIIADSSTGVWTVNNVIIGKPGK